MFPLGAVQWRILKETSDCEDCGVISLLRPELQHSRSDFKKRKAVLDPLFPPALKSGKMCPFFAKLGN